MNQCECTTGDKGGEYRQCRSCRAHDEYLEEQQLWVMMIMQRAHWTPEHMVGANTPWILADAVFRTAEQLAARSGSRFDKQGFTWRTCK